MREQCAQPYTALGEVYDSLAHHDYKRWSAYLLGLLKAGGVQPGSRLIDAACGTGGISVELARAGYSVLGMDISQQMLSAAANKASRAGAPVTFVCQDIRAMRVHRPMDAVLCCCDGVNYLTQDGDLADFLSGARRSLKKGGLLAFDISSEAKLTAMDGQFYGEETDDTAYLWSNEVDEAGKIITMDITFFRRAEGDLFRRDTEIHRQRIWQQAELELALKAAGFGVPQVYEAFTAEPPAADSARIQFVAVAL